ncbi:low molecular weight phosphatase family protein [Curtobacterium sp. MCLR17_007]|uniref:arsenate-mycothiol transferase ArsC n=1 Tax=unclassified Curtobacterium TaxID=257496 RepID=UPI0006F3F352|nr:MULTISPECIES: low molecular weight phosphatase family protein [unclassified Curtobacterium]KQO64114.1 protein tyrosine phosphatase [Curtobacterium sp. Leaf261]WIB61712.1 low molecular weight phosphatase family protein [Curtobacterium sp. MCLR17_007]
MTTKPTVLFICKHNAGRSQLGAALLELAAPERYTATSAGVTPAEAVNPSIAATVGELGLDITDRTPRKVTAELIKAADIVVLMKPGLELPATPRGTVLEWSFPDPSSWSPEDVRPLRDAVADRIQHELLKQ